MKSQLRVFVVTFLPGLLLCLLLLRSPDPAGATSSEVLTFENADIGIVAKEIGRLTGTTFLFDPERVTGRITLLAPRPVSPAAALELLRSALALHGYMLVARGEGMWIVPAERVAHEAARIEVVPLTYARADELAYILSMVAPPWVRIVPYYATNSLIISGDPAAVEQLVDIIK
jgi:type II secretory pathway component GspD/PulD (secretin)